MYVSGVAIVKAVPLQSFPPLTATFLPAHFLTPAPFLSLLFFGNVAAITRNPLSRDIFEWNVNAFGFCFALLGSRKRSDRAGFKLFYLLAAGHERTL